MEASATSGFAAVLASSAATNVVAADIPAACSFTGLQPATDYYVRYRVRNNGGRETSNERQWAFTTEADSGNVMLLVWQGTLATMGTMGTMGTMATRPGPQRPRSPQGPRSPRRPRSLRGCW